jgi:galactokinase
MLFSDGEVTLRRDGVHRTKSTKNDRALRNSKGFSELFGNAPRVFRAPGRVNLIGEHTDYNDGFVMPAAIEFATLIAAAPRLDRRLVVRSEAFPDLVDVDLDHLPTLPGKHWSDYVLGVAHLLELSGLKLTGANLLVRATCRSEAASARQRRLRLPRLALLGVSELQLDRLTMPESVSAPRLRQPALASEPWISCLLLGVRGHALALDCRAWSSRPCRFLTASRLSFATPWLDMR